MALSLCGTRTNQQGMELSQHGTGLFPVACYHDDLFQEAVPWHWHTELEAGVVTEGTAVIAVGNERFLAGQGEGFFINSGVLHAMWGRDGPSCRFHSAVFHPRLVGGSADSIFWQNYIQPLMGDKTRQSVHFIPGEPWHRQALEAVEAAWESCVEEAPGYDLKVREELSRLAFLLSRNPSGSVRPPSGRALRDEGRVKRMLQFIQENYASGISAADIAESASISESECLRCFRSTIGTPPGQYLKQFRIQKACEFLAADAWGVAEVGALCGFQDASYFTKTFRETKGCTPSEYRNAFGRAKNGGRQL